MIGVTSIEVYNSIFIITEENNKFKLYKLSQLMNDEGIYESFRIGVGKKFVNSRYHTPRSIR